MNQAYSCHRFSVFRSKLISDMTGCFINHFQPKIMFSIGKRINLWFRMNRGLAVKCPTLSELKVYFTIVRSNNMLHTVCNIQYAAYHTKLKNCELKPKVVQIIIFDILKFSFDHINRWIFMSVSRFQLLDKRRCWKCNSLLSKLPLLCLLTECLEGSWIYQKYNNFRGYYISSMIQTMSFIDYES